MSKIQISAIIHRDRPCEGYHNRKPMDAIERRRKFGPILPMQEPGFIETALRGVVRLFVRGSR